VVVYFHSRSGCCANADSLPDVCRQRVAVTQLDIIRHSLTQQPFCCHSTLPLLPFSRVARVLFSQPNEPTVPTAVFDAATGGTSPRRCQSSRDPKSDSMAFWLQLLMLVLELSRDRTDRQL
jgi:hypothetical protein